MDRIGTYMCAATIPMALLTVSSAAAGIALVTIGDWHSVLTGLVAFLLCLLLAPALERLVIGLDEAAAQTLVRRDRRRARLIAVASGGMPVLVILCWELACFRRFNGDATRGIAVLHWLWSYGVATGPWTLYGLRVSRFRRTLVGIRAYAGHLAYWILSALVLIVGLPTAMATPLMLLPAVLPFTVGMLLALADREALTNVRV